MKKRDRRLAELMDLSELFALKMSIDDRDEFVVLHFCIILIQHYSSLLH